MENGMEDFYDNLQDLVIDQAKRLINQTQYTKTLLSSLPVAILATDADGKIQTMNKNAENILATPLKKIKDQPIAVLFQNNPEITANIESTLHQGQTHHMRSKNLVAETGKKSLGTST